MEWGLRLIAIRPKKKIGLNTLCCWRVETANACKLRRIPAPYTCPFGSSASGCSHDCTSGVGAPGRCLSSNVSRAIIDDAIGSERTAFGDHLVLISHACRSRSSR